MKCLARLVRPLLHLHRQSPGLPAEGQFLDERRRSGGLSQHEADREGNVGLWGITGVQREAVLAAGALDAFTLDEQPSNAALQEDVSGFAEMSVMFPAFFLIAAAFATYVMLGRMIGAQQANIGTMRASGFKRRTILWHYAAIGVVIGIVASVIGVVLGALLAEAITRVYTGVLSIPAAVVEVRPTTILIGLLTGTDPTAEGSGNPGASNMYRVAGRRAGAGALCGAGALGAGEVGGPSCRAPRAGTNHGDRAVGDARSYRAHARLLHPDQPRRQRDYWLQGPGDRPGAAHDGADDGCRGT